MKNNKIVTIVQQPLTCRYTKEWYDVLSKKDDLLVLGANTISDIDRTKSYNYFANLEGSINYELDQIKELLFLDTIDKLLITDLDFPGIAIQCIPLLRLKYPNMKVYAILHAGSWINGDIFSENGEKKNQEDYGINLCKTIFVSTDYHKKKIMKFSGYIGDRFIVMNGMYFNPKQLEQYKRIPKTKDILLLGRKEQSVNIKLDKYTIDIHDTLIPREEYLKLLASYKICIINKTDDTFGYGVVESAACGVIPFVPNKYSYSEWVPKQFIFANKKELQDQITILLENYNTLKNVMYLDRFDLNKFSTFFDDVIKIIKKDN